MAYLGVNIHDNIILSSQLTQINDKGSLVVGFATNADTSDMLSAFDEGSNLERAENGIILFCPSIKGFDGKARVSQIVRNSTAEAFEKRLFAENGRGILIMVAWMDRVIYNRKGNEVMLVKKLSRK